MKTEWALYRAMAYAGALGFVFWCAENAARQSGRPGIANLIGSFLPLAAMTIGWRCARSGRAPEARPDG